MESSTYFKSIIDNDAMPIVICDLTHTIIYMNPCAVERYSDRGGSELVGKSLFDCHNQQSNDKIVAVINWFSKSVDNNKVFTFANKVKQYDVYMVALRDDDGKLIGYYEKHESRAWENAERYNFY